MNPLLTTLAIAAALWIGISAGFVAALWLSSRHDKAWEDERPKWADDATPLYDRLVCEQIEKAEGWTA